MRITIVRHGQTVENVKRICQGQLPGRLTEHGKQQAKNIAKQLESEDFDIVFSSDLARAKDTAKLLNDQKKVKIVYTKELRELNKGIFEGKSSVIFDNARKKAKKQLWNFIPKGGESWSNGYTRAKKFYNFLLKNYADKNILLVSHGTFIGILISAIMGAPVKTALSFEEHQTHECINVIEVNRKGKGLIKTVNCQKHIKNLVC